MGEPLTPVRRLLRDGLLATLVLAGLYGLAQVVPLRPLQIPGYLLVVGFDLLERAVGPAPHYDLLFAAYLLALGGLGAGAVRLLRRRSVMTDADGWRVGVGGGLAVVGGLAVAVFLGPSELLPALIAGAAGLVLVGLAAWLVGARRPTAGSE